MTGVESLRCGTDVAHLDDFEKAAEVAMVQIAQRADRMMGVTHWTPDVMLVTV